MIDFYSPIKNTSNRHSERSEESLFPSKSLTERFLASLGMTQKNWPRLLLASLVVQASAYVPFHFKEK